MATRVPTTTSGGKTGVRGGGGRSDPVDDGTVFRSMKEFWLWVAIVTLLIAILAFTLIVAAHVDKQLRETKAILQRMEQLDKEKKNDRRKKDPDEE